MSARNLIRPPLSHGHVSLPRAPYPFRRPPLLPPACLATPELAEATNPPRLEVGRRPPRGRYPSGSRSAVGRERSPAAARLRRAGVTGAPRRR